MLSTELVHLSQVFVAPLASGPLTQTCSGSTVNSARCIFGQQVEREVGNLPYPQGTGEGYIHRAKAVSRRQNGKLTGKAGGRVSHHANVPPRQGYFGGQGQRRPRMPTSRNDPTMGTRARLARHAVTKNVMPVFALVDGAGGRPGGWK
jgi:hypothetical protein